jgi:hypothetical protein
VWRGGGGGGTWNGTSSAVQTIVPSHKSAAVPNDALYIQPAEVSITPTCCREPTEIINPHQVCMHFIAQHGTTVVMPRPAVRARSEALERTRAAQH